MRLNKWQVLGIVISIGWVIGAAIHQRNADVKTADNFVSWAYKVCSQGKSLAHDSDLSSCDNERTKNIAIWLGPSWGNVAFASLAPVPLAWLAAFILLYIARAQVAGFRTVVPWAKLSVPKRIFVSFCVLCSAVAALLCVIEVLNLYTEERVPVALATQIPGTQTDSMVTVQGTWVRVSSFSGQEIDDPLQTSTISCIREQARCSIATARVLTGFGSNLLTSEIADYEIKSWSDKAIVFGSESDCVSDVFTIDVSAQVVNAIESETFIGRRPLCARAGEQVNYRLDDGFKVFWSLRQKARPWLLRVIHSMFGN